MHTSKKILDVANTLRICNSRGHWGVILAHQVHNRLGKVRLPSSVAHQREFVLLVAAIRRLKGRKRSQFTMQTTLLCPTWLSNSLFSTFSHLMRPCSLGNSQVRAVPGQNLSTKAVRLCAGVSSIITIAIGRTVIAMCQKSRVLQTK
jgi:hypothetical protein